MKLSQKLRRNILFNNKDPYWENVLLLIPGTTNYLDIKGSIFSNTNVYLNGVDPKFGPNSLFFNNNTNALVSTYNTSYNLANNDFTVECFIKPQNINTRMTIMTNRNGGTSGWLFAINASLNGRIGFAFVGGISGLNSDSVLIENEWQHIAATNKDNVLRLFHNGLLVSQGPANYSPNATMPIQIGRTLYDSGNYYPYAGFMEQIRITKGVARYTSNFKVPTNPFPTQ